MKTTQEVKNNATLPFNVRKQCAVCGSNGYSIKHRVLFSYNRSCKVCVLCSSKFSSPALLVEWLNAHAILSPRGQPIDFKRNSETVPVQNSQSQPATEQAGVPSTSKKKEAIE
jgi:hypothetical protein